MPNFTNWHFSLSGLHSSQPSPFFLDSSHLFSPLLSPFVPPLSYRLLSSSSSLPSESDCDGEVNPACIWLPLAADLLIMVDGQCRLITIFDPPRNPPLAWLWFPRIAASPKWGPAVLEVILGLLLKPQCIPIVFASIGNDWRLCFCAVSGAGILSNCAALLANFSPSFHSSQLLMRALIWCCWGCMVSTLAFLWLTIQIFFFMFVLFLSHVNS